MPWLIPLVLPVPALLGCAKYSLRLARSFGLSKPYRCVRAGREFPSTNGEPGLDGDFEPVTYDGLYVLRSLPMNWRDIRLSAREFKPVLAALSGLGDPDDGGV